MEHNRYIYRIRFEVIAESIQEADEKFAEQTHLKYIKGSKILHGWMCPMITVEIIRDPMLREQGEFESTPTLLQKLFLRLRRLIG